MVTASVLKGVITYLSSLNASSAVYNDDLTLVWTNCDEIFKKLDTKVISDAFPIKTEQPVPVTVDRTKYVMNVVPLYRSKRLVCGYVCVLRDSCEVYRMVNSSAVSDYNELFLRETQEKATRIVGISKVMEELISDGKNIEKLSQLVKEQYTQALRLFTEASGNSAVFSAKSESDGISVNCNVSALIAGLCAEANQCLVKTKRKLIKELDTRNYYARVDYKTFSVAFMSTLRSHMYISPLKSNIHVTSRFEDGDYLITVKTDMLSSISFLQEIKSQQDRELARRIVVFDCGGNLTFTEDNGTAVSEMRIPVIKKNRGPSLHSSNSDYLTGNYKPVHPFIDEITEKEELALNTAKEPKTSSASGNHLRKRRKK